MLPFQTDALLSSDPRRVREKNATGQPSWFKVVAMAKPEAPVSTVKGLASSMARKVILASSYLIWSKDVLASSDNGNESTLFKRCTFSEKFLIHLVYRGLED